MERVCLREPGHVLTSSDELVLLGVRNVGGAGMLNPFVPNIPIYILGVGEGEGSNA